MKKRLEDGACFAGLGDWVRFGSTKSLSHSDQKQSDLEVWYKVWEESLPRKTLEEESENLAGLGGFHASSVSVL
jgi:hypothetical protein